MTVGNPLLPAEWSRQWGTILTWPHSKTDWAPWLALQDSSPSLNNRLETEFAALAHAIAARQKLVIICYDDRHETHVRGYLSKAGKEAAELGHPLQFIQAKTNDTWVRDYGPITVMQDGQRFFLDFTFNGWGQKCEAGLDTKINQYLKDEGVMGDDPLVKLDLVLEGGSIETDGKGTLITTTRCLLSPYRNPKMNQADYESFFRGHFGTDRVLWLEHGHLEGDDTDGHIDTLVRFCDPATLCYVSCDNPIDSHYEELRTMEAQLKGFRQRDGQPYRLIPLPWPGPIENPEGDRIPATYANFLMVNGAVLVPNYGVDQDRLALETIADCFPSHDIVSIPSRTIIQQYGSLHCLTMQIPEKTDT